MYIIRGVGPTPRESGGSISLVGYEKLVLSTSCGERPDDRGLSPPCSMLGNLNRMEIAQSAQDPSGFHVLVMLEDEALVDVEGKASVPGTERAKL